MACRTPSGSRRSPAWRPLSTLTVAPYTPDMGTIRQTFKRWTVLIHRYLGIGLALLFVMWFATGIVLIYAPFPGFGADRDYARLPRLTCEGCTRPLGALLATIGPRDSLAPVRVGMLEHRPVLRVLGPDGAWRAWFTDGTPTAAVLDSVTGARIAGTALRIPLEVARTVRRLDTPDQWTMEGAIRRQLPMWRVDFADDAGTRVYVSVHGGEPVTASTRRARALAWVGAIPHWLYPRVLRSHVGTWTWTILVLGALGTVMSAAGLSVGLWQTRWRRRRRDGRPAPLSPYRHTLMRWHHLTGLMFGLVTCTWIFSGMMSVTPFDWSPGDHPDRAARRAFAGRVVTGAGFTLTPAEVLHGVGPAVDVRELETRVVGGAARWVAFDGDGRATPLRADGQPGIVPPLDSATILRQAVAAAGGAAGGTMTRLSSPDDYYYDSVERHRPFPVVRLEFRDAVSSALYVDPVRAELVMRQERLTRWERWLYHGLHDLDFAALRTRRPAWDVVVIVLSLGGLVLSWSGMLVAVRWLVDRWTLPARPRR